MWLCWCPKQSDSQGMRHYWVAPTLPFCACCWDRAFAKPGVPPACTVRSLVRAAVGLQVLWAEASVPIWSQQELQPQP